MVYCILTETLSAQWKVVDAVFHEENIHFFKQRKLLN